jgi:hypothetical protein
MADPLLGYQLAMSSKTGVVDSTSTTSGEKDTNQKSKVEVFRYPYNLKIDRDTDYLEIRIAEYQPPGIQLQDNSDILVQDNEGNLTGEFKKDADLSQTKLIGQLATGTAANQANLLNNPKAYIALPIPQSISDSTEVSWGPDPLDPLSAFGLSFGVAAVDRDKSAAAIISSAAGTLGKALEDKKTKDLIIAAVAGRAYGALGGNVDYKSIISRASGRVFNPNLELLFNGVNLRSFPFAFDFAPRNSAEARTVKGIIRTLKKSMTAKNSGESGAGGVFISAPDIFQLTYKRGPNSHPFLNKFKPMALTNMTVNYTGSNNYSTYADGTPIHINVILQFTELNPVYNEDYDTEMGKEGVGF